VGEDEERGDEVGFVFGPWGWKFKEAAGYHEGLQVLSFLGGLIIFLGGSGGNCCYGVLCDLVAFEAGFEHASIIIVEVGLFEGTIYHNEYV
jgi:hypothetical protein